MNQADAIVSLLNSRSSQSPKAYARAAERVSADAKLGMPLQRYMLAVLQDTPGLPESARLDDATRQAYLESSRERIRRLGVERGNPLALYLLSMEGNDPDLLKRAADGGNVQALNAYGNYLVQKAMGESAADTNAVASLLAAGFDCFRRAAAKKDANGLYNVGMCYMQGIGGARDGMLAFESFRMAAEAGHPEAINNIGGCYRDGVIVRRSPEMAVRWFEKSAELGNAYGQLNYALALQRGDGVPQDLEKSVELLKASCAQGCAEAMDAYGMCHYSGLGVRRDQALAAAWFRKSADLGFPPAMDNLAACYEKGAGVERSEGRAMLWRMRARASRGDRSAAEWLETGAVPKDD
jgi:hypothetical protein